MNYLLVFGTPPIYPDGIQCKYSVVVKLHLKVSIGACKQTSAIYGQHSETIGNFNRFANCLSRFQQ